MRCPACNIELRIKRSYTSTEDGNAVTVQELHCLNPQCSRYSETYPTKILKHKHHQSQSEYETCDCGTVLMKADNTSYSLPDNSEYTLKDGKGLTIKCPECEKTHQFDVEGKTQK